MLRCRSSRIPGEMRFAARDRARAAGAACLAGLLVSCTASEQRMFATPEDAAGALIEAIRAESDDELVAIFGPESREILDSGDTVADRTARQRFQELYEEKSLLEPASEEDAYVLHVGELEWPFPIPIVGAEDGLWRFDTEAGQDEVINRRIGRNELSAIEVCLAWVDAQREYMRVDRDGDGILEYARKLRSSPGARDGLYWEVADGDEPSPMGELVAQAAKEGYGAGGESGTIEPYHGYFYRILEAQGTNAPGGAYEYVVRDNMFGGCAVVAWPAKYGASGVKSFLVSHDGVVHEKDLGEETETIVEGMTVYDPDPSWTVYSP